MAYARGMLDEKRQAIRRGGNYPNNCAVPLAKRENAWNLNQKKAELTNLRQNRVYLAELYLPAGSV